MSGVSDMHGLRFVLRKVTNTSLKCNGKHWVVQSWLLFVLLVSPPSLDSAFAASAMSAKHPHLTAVRERISNSRA